MIEPEFAFAGAGFATPADRCLLPAKLWPLRSRIVARPSERPRARLFRGRKLHLEALCARMNNVPLWMSAPGPARTHTHEYLIFAAAKAYQLHPQSGKKYDKPVNRA
jgi:hypothetical protein